MHRALSLSFMVHKTGMEWVSVITALEGRGKRISELKASLVFGGRSRAARATQRNLDSKTKQKIETPYRNE